MNMDLAKRLAELRRDKGLSKKELAAKAGIPEKEMTEWERGEAYPDGSQLVKLSQAYNMPIDEILLNFDTDGDDYTENEEPENADSENHLYNNPVTHTIEKNSEKNLEEKPEKKSFNWYAFPYPIIVLIAYLSAGFFFHIWHPTWIMFLTIPIYYMMLNVNNEKTIAGKATAFPYPIVITILYLAIGFDYGIWHPGWMLFLTIPVYYMMVTMLSSRK